METIAHTIAQLADDIVSGAATLAERAADILVRRARSSEAATPAAFRHELLTTGWALIRAQPTMAPMVNLVDAMLWKLEQAETREDLYQAVIDSTEQFKRQMRQHGAQVAEEALALIPEGSTIATLSHSSTVIYALLHAQRAGRHFSVLCAESRPALEGRITAEKLAAKGLPVTLMTDMALVAALSEADLVLLGADMLTSAGLVSKIGSYALALAAHQHNVPLYVLCSSKKFAPTGYVPPPQREWGRRGLWEEAPRGVAVRNYFYDFVPLDDITGVVTEQGVLPAATIEAWLAVRKVHAALAPPQPLAISVLH